MERTSNPFAEPLDEDDQKDLRRFKDFDTQPLCDNCKGPIEGVRVLKMRELRYVGAFCSYMCSRDWEGPNVTKSSKLAQKE